VDVRYINPFLEAVNSVLTTMGGVTPRPGKPFLKKDSKALGDVTGIIGITGDATGSLSITFTEPCIKAIVANMLDISVPAINKDVLDAVGEITNMICGDARRRLQKENINLSGAIPTIVSGKDHSVRHISNSPVLVVPFETDNGGLVIEVALD